MSGNDIQLRAVHRLAIDEPPAYDGLPPTAPAAITVDEPSKQEESRGLVNPAYIAQEGEAEQQQHHHHQADPNDATEDEVEQYEESSDDEDDEDAHLCNKLLQTCVKTAYSSVNENSTGIWTCGVIVFALLYYTYFGYAMYWLDEEGFDWNNEGAVRLIFFTGLVSLAVALRLAWNKWMASDDTWAIFDPDTEDKQILLIRNLSFWVVTVGTLIAFVAFVVIEVAVKHVDHLRSAAGMVVFVGVLFIFSTNPAKVNWRPVFWGLAIQFYFALLILRWNFGFQAFEWLGARVAEFLAHTDKGTDFVLGEYWCFAFRVLTVIVFFSSVISVLYYMGAMQFVIRTIARFLAFFLGTSPAESLCAAGNIFIGQSESPLLIRPFLKDMTKSEIHAVCTGGFATIAGSVMAAYIIFGVPSNHLLAASVMSAPAALAMAKLFYPETKKVKQRGADVYNLKIGTENNIFEAASNGASISISLIANIAVNLIAFIALLEFVNRTLAWFGHRIGFYNPELTFDVICSYIFYPVAFFMGIPIPDIFKVASLIGTKTFLNEFVAYTDLQTHIKNNELYFNYMAEGGYNGTTTVGDDIILHHTNTILKRGLLSARSVMISTYALCGFSNFASIGIMIGALSAMAPTRKRDITKVVFRAMIAGNVACFMTACIAGLVHKELDKV